MTDLELAAALRAREHDAIDYLQRHYGPLMRYIIAPILPDPRDREEAFSDIILRVWDHIGTFDQARGSFPAWLSALTRNAAIDRARRTPAPDAALKDTDPAPDSDPEAQLLRRERSRLLAQALKSLPEGERALFYRKYYYRQSTAQIAGELGTTERAIEGKLYRIRRKLRMELGGADFD